MNIYHIRYLYFIFFNLYFGRTIASVFYVIVLTSEFFYYENKSYLCSF